MQKTYSSKEISYWLQIFDQNGYLEPGEIYNMGGDRDLVKPVKKGVKAVQVKAASRAAKINLMEVVKMDDATYIKRQKDLADSYVEGDLSDSEYIKKQADLAHRHIEGEENEER